jgi:hypothetical protein
MHSGECALTLALDEKGGRFPARLKLPYVIRPITGALTGLLTFLVGNLLVSTLAVDATTRSVRVSPWV